MSIGINDDIEKIKALEDNILEQYNKNVELANKMEQETEKFAKQANTAIEDYNSNAEVKTEEFNTNAKEKTDEFNSNATEKETEISDIADGFDANVEEKTNTFNSNVETKTTEFNNNSNTKTEEFNNNSTEKINAFNSNAEEKIADYNEHVETFTSRIADLEEENSELAQQMPWNTTKIQESIYVADSARYSKNKLSLFGNMAQETREGYNLLDISNIQTQEKYGVTITNNGDGTLTFNGTSTNNFGINTEIEPKTLLAGNYTKSIPRDTNIKTGLTISLGTVSGGAIPKTTLQPSTGTATFELEEDSTYNQLRMYIGSGTIFKNYVLKWMIVKGTYTSETIPPFEQYGAMPSIEYPSMPVVTTGLQTVKKYSKNLCKRFINGSTYRYWAAFYLDCNLEKGKYYALSFTDLSVGNVYYRNENVAGANGKYSSYAITSTGKRQTWIFLCKENNKNMGGLYIKDRGYFFLKNSKQQEQPSNLVDVQLEEVTSLSSLATSYEPYNGEDITLDLGTTELCKIGNYNDYIYIKSGIWYKHNRINKIILTGSETFNNNYGVHLFNTLTVPNSISQAGGVSNYYRYNKVQSKLDATMVNGEFAVQKTKYDNATKIFVKNTNFSDASNFKQYLKNLYDANNPVVIYYPLETAIDEQITNESLIGQLEKIYKLKLEKGVNNIFVESKNGVTTELQLEYMQDSNLIQKEEHKALEDRITAIEALLSTTQTSALLLDNMQEDLEKEVE